MFQFGHQTVQIILEQVLHLNILEEISIECLARYDQWAQLSLLQRFLEDVLFNRIHTDKPVDMYSLRLANSVWSVLSLFIHCWIPIRIIENDAVCPCEIDTNSTAPCRWNKAEELRWEVKSVNHLLSLFYFDTAVESDIWIAVQIQKLLKDVQHARHLCKDQHLRSLQIQGLQ